MSIEYLYAELAGRDEMALLVLGLEPIDLALALLEVAGFAH